MASDTSAWLVALLTEPRQAGAALHWSARNRARLEGMPFQAVISAMDAARAAGGQFDTAAVYQRWIGCNAGSPFLFAAWFNLAVVLRDAGDYGNAIVSFRNAIALKPGFQQAVIGLGSLLESRGDHDGAIEVWKQGMQPDIERVTLLNNQGRLLERSNRLEEAERALRTSMLTDPDQPGVVHHWIYVRQKLCKWPVVEDQSVELRKDRLLASCGPLSMLALSDSVSEQTRCVAGWVARNTHEVARLSPPQGYRHDRIRLGYMSSDFCQHAMTSLITELFESHDRERFELFGYCLSPDDSSEIRRRVISAFDRFVSIKEMSDEAAAHTIRDDEIDILIDLNGPTGGARMQILRWKPAPIQATYLGFVGPVPVPELDYILCDDWVVPPAIAPLYQPQPLYIAQNYQANDSKRVIGRTPSRAAIGLPEDKFLFCCFSKHYKITPEMFGCWMTILRRTENTVLWLISENDAARANIMAAAADAGVAAERIVFTNLVQPADYMAQFVLADLFLDTFPYNAGTIASDAIRMRLPLLTVSGEAFASRMAGRLLAAVGAVEGIARSMEEYVETAVVLASDRERYAAYKARFTEEAWGRTIGDVADFTRQFEAALLGVQAKFSAATQVHENVLEPA